ncbi:hypothetical protein [Brevundimonas sp.]|jgi:hypothetical protein|uniref:pPIWI-associating nuclease domain-containing protein n=1 Tax=Brevundimonas sp. TaxID=1871086 RepID=UPI0037C119FD
MTHALDIKFLAPLEADRRSQVIDAISDLSAEDEVLSDAMGDLSLLSKATVFDGIDPSPDGIFKVGKSDEKSNTFEANATVYVTLQYGGSKDGVAMSDAYPASVAGHFEQDRVVIDQVTVNTRSFYE